MGVVAVVLVIVVFIILSPRQAEKRQGIFVQGVWFGEREHIYQIHTDTYIDYDFLSEHNLIDTYHETTMGQIYIYKDFNRYTIDLTIEPTKVFQEIEDSIFINLNYLEGKFKDSYKAIAYPEVVFLEKNEHVVMNDQTIWFYDGYNQPMHKIQRVAPKSQWVVYDTIEDYVYVRYNDQVGYIRNWDVSTLSIHHNRESLHTNYFKEIVLAWDFFTRRPTTFQPDPIYPGLNVVSPTWFEIDIDTYTYKDWHLQDYVDYYEAIQIQVWPAFSNAFNPRVTSEILNNYTKRWQLINEIIQISKTYGYKGINIDFENIYLEDKDVFALFIRDLYIAARRENIIMSIDLTIISNSPTWSMFYDREVLGEYSDYLMLMAYDERTRPEHGIGSIASLPWVEFGVDHLLNYAPNHKIVLGLPFYTRLWETIRENGTVKYDVTALKITTAENFVANRDFVIVYDEEAGQFYGEYTEGNVFYQIWIEDTVSLSNRLAIVEKYDLAGVAVWALDYGSLEMWQVIKDFFR